MEAAEKGNLSTAQEPVRRGAKVDAKGEQCGTPLIMACNSGHFDVARFVLDEGAAIEARTDRGLTSLYCASIMGHTEIVKLLIVRGAVVDTLAIGRATPLYVAIDVGHALIVRELLARGAYPNTLKSNGWAPLHVAAERGHADAVCELLRTPETDVNASTDDGRTPLMLACQWGRLEIANVLIVHKDIHLGMVDPENRTALSWARICADGVGADEAEERACGDAKTIIATLERLGAS